MRHKYFVFVTECLPEMCIEETQTDIPAPNTSNFVLFKTFFLIIISKNLKTVFEKKQRNINFNKYENNNCTSIIETKPALVNSAVYPLKSKKQRMLEHM